MLGRPVNTGAFGDVHFQTIDGLSFSFNGAGDYVFLKKDGMLEIHTRSFLVMPKHAASLQLFQDFASPKTYDIVFSATLAAIAIHDVKSNQIAEISNVVV